MNTSMHIDGEHFTLSGRKLLTLHTYQDDVTLLKKALRKQGFWSGSNSTYFGTATEAAVKHFQGTHIGENGKFLLTDGVVGPRTWWAIFNPSGVAQQSNIPNPKGEFEERYGMLSLMRQVFIDAALKEHADRVHEIPDGSNKGDGVTKYLAGYGPVPWCCLFVSWLYKQASGMLPLGEVQAHVQTFWRAAKEAGMTLPKDAVPAPGDCIVWAFPKGAGHIAVVVAASVSGKSINTIGGNEGNRVKLGLRKPQQERHVVGYIRLFQDDPSGYPCKLIEGTDAGGLSLAGTR